MPRSRSKSVVTTCAPRRAWGAVAGVMVVAALIGGCTGQAAPDPYASITDEPFGDPTAITSPAPSPTADIYAAPADAYVKPVRPAILDGKPSEDAAIAFAKYYLRMYTYAYLTGDADGLNALGKPGCTYCSDVAKDLAREYGAGGHDEGGAITIDKASAHDFGVDGAFKVVLDGRQAPSREVDSQGSVVIEYPHPTRFEYDFALVWTAEDAWLIEQMAAVER